MFGKTTPFFLVVALLVAPAGIGAAHAAAAPTAQELYGSAQQAFDKGQYADALILFRQAYDASKSPNARIMVGNCLVALGRSAEAYEEMSATMREAALRAESDPKYAKTRDSAATQLALLEPKVGKIIVDLAGQTDVTVMLNGAPLAGDRLGAMVAVDPGKSIVIARRADGASARLEEVIEAGQVKRIVVEFPKDEPTPKPEVTPKPIEEAAPKPIAPPPPSGGGVRKAGFAVLGAGVAGMALFAIAGGMAKSRFDSLSTKCGPSACPTSDVDAIDGGKSMQTAANVGLGLGLAGLVGGGLMVVFGGPSASPAPAQGVSISYSGTF